MGAGGSRFSRSCDCCANDRSLEPVGTITSLTGVVPDSPASLRPKLVALFQHESPLRELVQTSFLKVVGTGRHVGKQALGLSDLPGFTSCLGQALGLPEFVFDGMTDEFLRFDFNQDGLLEFHECFKLVRTHLRHRLQKDQSDVFAYSIRYATIEKTGCKVVQQTGYGGYGSAVRAVDRATSAEWCFKVLPKETMTAVRLEDFLEDLSIIKKVNSSHIARAFDVFHDDQHVYFVHEMNHGGDFTTLVGRAFEQQVTPTEAWWRNIFWQCLTGLKQMQTHALMHCDIKEKNLMLRTSNMAEPEVVFVDTGLAASSSSSSPVCGTLGYIPPETWLTRKWWPKGDCFSIGVVMLQLVTTRTDPGIFVAGARSIEEVQRFTCTREPPLEPLFPRYQTLAGLLTQLLEKRQVKRLSALQALHDPWFSGLSAAASSNLSPMGAIASGLSPMSTGSTRDEQESLAQQTYKPASAAPFNTSSKLDYDGDRAQQYTLVPFSAVLSTAVR